MRKIAIIGPESTGKSTLAAALAERLDTLWVPEYARFYLDENVSGPKYDEDDLLKIAQGQLALEALASKKAHDYLICDTNLAVILIWAKDKFGSVPKALEALWKPGDYSLHLLLKPDVPWQPDPLREDPHRRDELFEVYRTFLEQKNIPYAIVDGVGEERVKRALRAVK
ncbi:MAG: AAA family ATPase [Bacteroidia bacterium]